MWKFIRDLKIKYKIFFIFAVLLFLAADSWVFSYTSLKDIDASYARLESYSVPTLLTVSELKDGLNFALANVTDYVATGNQASKTKFEDNFRQAVVAEVVLFQLAQTEEDIELTKLFEEKINNINDGLDSLVKTYEQDPANFNWQTEVDEVNQLRDDLDIFLSEQITVKAQQQIDEAAQTIDQTVQRITLYLWIVVVGMILLAVFLFWFISHNITQPVKLLTTAAARMGQGQFSPVELDRRDELGIFAQTFNQMGRDITAARVALENELVKTKELDRQKSEFLSIAAHQLRTPMAGLKWVMNMMLEGDMGPLSKEQKHHLEKGAENSERMIKLINDLLDVTRMEEQKFQYKPQPQDLKAIWEAVIATLDNNAKQKQIKIVLNAAAGLAPVRVDLEKIKIAFTNLLSNAIKYSPTGKTVTMELKPADAEHLLISITDQGYGIPKNQQNQVFDKFFRGSNILKIETELTTIGTGLGLYITKDIITKHEGEIWFESEENKGTTFYIKLPY